MDPQDFHKLNLEPHSASPAPGEPASPLADAPVEFVALFLAHRLRLHRYIASLVGNFQDAEDVLQDTALVLWRKFADYQPGTHFFAWSSKTAYLLVLEHRRRNARETSTIDSDVLEQLATLAVRDDASLEIQLEALARCMARLKRDDRRLIDRCYVADVKVKEAAAELQRTAKSVRRSLGRIRGKLLECIRRSIAIAKRKEGDE